jgi:hypothetical protein
MRNKIAAGSALLILLTVTAYAEEAVTCKGSITSKQGEGMVFKTFRFDVTDVTGSDMKDMLERCKTIALQKQNKAGHANPALKFRKFSDLDLDCTQGTQKFQVRRSLQTGP